MKVAVSRSVDHSDYRGRCQAAGHAPQHRQIRLWKGILLHWLGCETKEMLLLKFYVDIFSLVIMRNIH